MRVNASQIRGSNRYPVRSLLGTFSAFVSLELYRDVSLAIEEDMVKDAVPMIRYIWLTSVWMRRLFNVCCLNWQPAKKFTEILHSGCKPRADSAAVIQQPPNVKHHSNLTRYPSIVQLVHVMTLPKHLFKTKSIEELRCGR